MRAVVVRPVALRLGPRIGLGRLRKAGNKTEGHFAINDGLVESVAYGLPQCIDYLLAESDVAVLQQEVVDDNDTTDLISVDLNGINGKFKLVECACHLHPHAFRNVSHNILTGIAANGAKAYAGNKL